jgi:hypothetical protein
LTNRYCQQTLQTTSLWNVSFSTQGDLIPNMVATTGVYRDNDYPVLDASSSQVVNGTGVTYEWLDVSQSGVTFLSADALITAITVPNGVTEDVVVGMRMTNDDGVAAQYNMTLKHAPIDGQFIILNSAPGDYIGQGQQWALTDVGGITIQYDPALPNFVEVQYNANDNWLWYTMTIELANDTPLAVGVYDDATRYPFQAEGVDGFDFGGDGRGCNRLNADFEILALSIDADDRITELAVDFTQYCESRAAPPLTGKVRINSALPINQ